MAILRRRTFRPGRGGGARGGRAGGHRGYGAAGVGGFGVGFSLTPWAKRLLVANTVVFVASNLLGVPPFGWTVRTLGFSPAGLLRHPWSPLTYMFVHGGFWHLFFNMVGLFFFGPPLERAWGSRYFLRYYLVAGLGGAFFSLLMAPAIGTRSLVIGASGALYGLLLAFALRWPDAPIYVWGLLPVPAKWFVGILGLLAFFSTVSAAGGGVAHWAHLGGLVTGFLFLRFDDRIARASRRLRRGLERLFFREEAPLRVEPGASRREAPPRRRRPPVGGDTLERVDAILDKIREGGMESLTEEERRFLDEVSRRYQETK